MGAERQGIMVAMLVGLAVSLTIVFAGPVLHLLGSLNGGAELRAKAFAMAALPVILFMTVAIARLARHRFFHFEDLDPLAQEPSQTALSLQNQLQNTIEQGTIAIAAYAVWYACGPDSWGQGPLVAAALFALGRVLFFAGYEHGASARALGFTLTFYPTLAVTACSALAAYGP